jgi:hypothetical protein
MRKSIIVIFLFASLSFLALPCWGAETIAFVIEDSPYYLHQDLVIKEGEIFTAEPGVVIEMAKDASIIVEGRIDISGYPKGGEIVFKAQEPAQNYHKGFWKGIIIKSKQRNLISYCVIQHAKVGIEVKSDSSVNITSNIVTQNKTGIKAEEVKELSIVRNNFLSNFIDIELADSTGSIERNYFVGSLTCLRLKQGYPRIQRNFFKQAYKNIIESYNESELSAGRNFWGSADEELIKNRIFQGGKGKFIFKPYLLEPPDLRQVGVDLKNSCTSCR